MCLGDYKEPTAVFDSHPFLNRTSYDGGRMETSVPIAAQQTWLNTRRLCVHGTILALCLWGTYAWMMATPGLLDRNGLVKGTDFLHFYTLGSLALEHRGAELYDMGAQAALVQQRVPEAGKVFFLPLYAPQVSLLFAPLAMLSYPVALSVWLVFNAALYVCCCWLIWRSCPALRSDGWLVFLLVLANPGFFHLIAWGQTTVLVLACFTAAYLALRAGRTFAAGLAIGCLMVKPQLGLAAAFVFLGAREWSVVSGATTSAVAQLSLGWAYYGTSVLRDYVQQLLHVGTMRSLLEPRLYQTHSLWSFWTMLLPWPVLAFWLYVVSAVAVLVVASVCWSSAATLSLRFSALLLASVLVSPHLTVYDLVILAPLFLLLADWRRSAAVDDAPGLGILLYGCYLLPLTGPLARWTHLQLTVPAMVAALGMIYRAAVRREIG